METWIWILAFGDVFLLGLVIGICVGMVRMAWHVAKRMT